MIGEKERNDLYVEIMEQIKWENSLYPEEIANIAEKTEGLILAIRELVLRYDQYKKLPLYHTDTDFENLDMLFDMLYREIIKLTAKDVVISKKFSNPNLDDF